MSSFSENIIIGCRFNFFFLALWSCYSHMIYPTPSQEQLPAENPALLRGKFEPLVHMNQLLNMEIRKVMENLVKATPPLVSSHSLLSGALSKSLCCILGSMHDLDCNSSPTCNKHKNTEGG